MSTAQQRPFTPEPTPLLEEKAPAAVESAPVDNEWVGEKTILIAEQSDPAAWLQRVDTGEWVCLLQLPAILGRHERAEVVLDDPSVSRRHARLVREGDHAYAIEDLGSSNGIRIAGNRVERMLLLDGDEFALGNVLMRFSSCAPEALAAVTQASSAARADDEPMANDLKRLLPMAAALLAVLAGVLYATRSPRTVVVPAPVPAAQSPAVQQIPASAATPVPAATVQPATVQPAGADTQPAAPAPAAAEVTEPIVVKDEPVVLAETDAPASSSDTGRQVAPDLQSATLRKLEAPADAPAKASRSSAGSQPVTGAAKAPDPAELGRSLAEAPVAARPRPAPKPRVSSQPVRRSAEFSRAYIDAALQMYLDGDSANAIRRLGIMSRSRRNQAQFRDEAAVLQKQVEALVANYEQGQSALDRGDRAEAAAAWAKFLRDEGDLFGGSSSVYAKRISRVVAEQYVRDGDQANADGRFHDAYRYWTKAMQYEPDGVARDSIAQLELKGQQLFREGYRLESVSIERAKALWMEVTEILPPGTEYHTKARAKLRWHEQGGR